MPLELNGTTEIVYDNLNQNITTLMQPKNWIINGGFDVWQRGTSQTIDSYGSDDRWINEHYVSTKTHSRQAFTVGQTEVPNNPTYFSRTVANAIAGAYSKVVKNQSIEDVTKLAGKTISLSFWAKADANKYISVSFRQLFGTGGSSNVSGIGVQKFNLTTSWQKITLTVAIPSVIGKTIGANSALQLRIWMSGSAETASEDANLGNQSGTFDIANVSLVEGSVPVEWQTEAYADVLRQCQRYYRRTNALTPYSWYGSGASYNTTKCRIAISLETPMRTSPSSIEYLNVSLQDQTTMFAVSSVIIDPNTNSNNNLVLEFTSTGLTTFRPYFLFASNTTTSYIAFSAEL